MMLGRAPLLSFTLIAGLNSACTFYTECPDYRASPAPSGNGGSSSGGTSGTGATVSVGGEAPQGEWANETFNLTELTSECGNVTYISPRPDRDQLIVSIAQHGLLAKASDGEEWLPIGQGKGSAVITNRAQTIVYDPSDPDVFWEAGIYNGGGVYRTDDGGDTFLDLGLRHDDFVSVDFDDPKRQTLLASGHEVPGLLHYSNDGGTTWSDIGPNFPEEAHICSWPVVLDASTFLLGCSTYGGGTGGIFRSTDVGETWERVSDHRITPGPLFASNGSQYWSGEVNEGIVRTDDQGLTFEGPFGKPELTEATPVELPNGKIAALGQRRIVVSADEGATWRVVTTELPFQPNGILYSREGRKFYAYHWTCANQIPSDAVLSYAFDYEAE